MIIRDERLLQDFVDWVVYYQKIRLDELQGVPSTDPVIMRDRENGLFNCRLEDIFREQNHLDVFEQEICHHEDLLVQIQRILFFRHSWSMPLTKLFIAGNLSKETMAEAREQASCPSEYIYTGVMWPFIFTRNGVTREDNILAHAEMVRAKSDETMVLILRQTTPREMFEYVKATYPLIGPFRAYEVVVSFCKRLPFYSYTGNDLLHIGPGSRPLFTRLLGSCPTLAEVRELVVEINERLNGRIEQLLDVKALEDGLCEYRKYLSMKEDLYSQREVESSLDYLSILHWF